MIENHISLRGGEKSSSSFLFLFCFMMGEGKYTSRVRRSGIWKKWSKVLSLLVVCSLMAVEIPNLPSGNIHDGRSFASVEEMTGMLGGSYEYNALTQIIRITLK
jgi:hypothetical protein